MPSGRAVTGQKRPRIARPGAGTLRDDQSGPGVARPARQARRGRRDAGLAGALRHPLRGLRRPELCPVHGQVPDVHRRQSRGHRHAELLDRHGEREHRSRPAHLSRLREAGPLGFVLRRQQGISQGRPAGCGGDRTTVRLEGADRRGRRRQRGRMCHLGERSGSARRRGGSDRAVSRLLQDPSGERAGKRFRELDTDRSRRHLGGVALARSGDGKGRLSRPGMQGTVAGGHVPQGGRNGGPQRGQHVARHDLIQPLSENDGGRRVAARRGDRPDGVVGIDRNRR